MNWQMPTANSLEPYWMPFTANRQFKAHPRMIARAEGMYYYTDRGDALLDGSSGLFCVGAGHGRKQIAEAAHRTLLELDYAPAFQYGHPLSFELARRVAQVTPDDLNYIFFTNSGSESVDTALKIALAYHRARGEAQRQRLIGREKGYHGVNFGGVSVAGMMPNKKAFGLALPGVAHIRHTLLEENKFTPGQPEHGAELANDLQRLVDLHGDDTIAACIVEPIAGSVGCIVPPKGYLERLREICDQYGILLIFDEVICGFGRTGKQFGADSFGVTPDLMTMAKALTNGVVPMGAVACSEKIYETITGAAPDMAVELFHGYTYSGCPVASAAGLATRDIFEEEGLVERAAAMSPKFLEGLFELKDLPVVTDIRGYGLFGTLDIAPLERPGLRGARLTQELFEAGLIIKMTSDALLVSPPFICEDQHLDELFTKIRDVLKTH